MKKIIYFTVFIFCLIKPINSIADTLQDEELFKEIFQTWTDAFNSKDLKTTCNLFSKSLTANYQGVPKKNYHSLCTGFNNVFMDNQRQYLYHFKLHNIYRSGDLAAVRITWYLRILKNGKLISATQDEGLDIFKKEKGHWKIVNYLGYQA